MTKPRITAAMLRKRPQTAPAAPADDRNNRDPEDVPQEAAPALPMQSGSIADHPSFRAPQFGIRPKKEMQPTVRVHHAPRRGSSDERA